MIQPIKMFSALATRNIQQQNYNPQFHVNFATKPDSFEKTVPQKQILAPAYIPFTGWAGDEPIRKLGHIACPCCGLEMMTQKDFNEVSKHLGATSESAIEILNKYEKNMRPIEKECFNLIKTWAKDKPNSNFKALLMANKKPQLKILQEKQNKIIDSVDELSKNLSAKEQEEVQKIIGLTKNIVLSNDKDVKFKRKVFIRDIENLGKNISNKEIHQQMVEIANKMPNSQNDVSSFIVKYSDRGHKEIGERLVKLSVGTIEHIHPRSEGGKNNIGNYMLECAGCNHERSSIPLGDWIDNHPEMIENTQKHIDEVIRRINEGEAKDLVSYYPKVVAETLYKESDGKLEINTEALNPKEED